MGIPGSISPKAKELTSLGSKETNEPLEACWCIWLGILRLSMLIAFWSMEGLVDSG